jgi:peptidoglycan/xylan/chitin deacetylase (PgdA/CDA1 family)
MYHSVADDGHFLSVSSSVFEQQIEYMKNNGFTFLRSDDLLSGNINNKSVLITFDDGYENNFLIAVPILKKYNVPAIFFIATGLVGTENKGMKMMNWKQVIELSKNNLFEIGAHTISHKKLHKMNIEELKKEVMESKSILEEKTNKNIKSFAYPFGRYNKIVIDMVKKNGYQLAFSINPGRINKSNNLFEIKRFGIDNNTSQFFKDIFKTGYNLYWQLRWIFYK